MEQGKVTIWVAENWKWILAILGSMAVSYSEYVEMRGTVERTEARLQNYIDRFNEHKIESDDIHKQQIIEITILKQQIKQCQRRD